MRTEQAILDQASDETAEIEVFDLVLGYDTLIRTAAWGDSPGIPKSVDL